MLNVRTRQKIIIILSCVLVNQHCGIGYKNISVVYTSCFSGLIKNVISPEQTWYLLSKKTFRCCDKRKHKNPDKHRCTGSTGENQITKPWCIKANTFTLRWPH